METQLPAEELHPHLVYRADEGNATCATWRLKEGHEALAMFSTSEVAESYGKSMTGDERWQIVRPDRAALVDVLKACAADNVLYAVLDPDESSAKRIFDIRQLLAAAE